MHDVFHYYDIKKDDVIIEEAGLTGALMLILKECKLRKELQEL